MNPDEFTPKQIEAIKHIRNHTVHKGRSPSIRELMGLLESKSIKSVQEILFTLQQKGIIKKFEDGHYKLVLNPDLGQHIYQTIDVPIVGMVSCGNPLFAEENVEGYLPVSTTIAEPGSKYFLLKVSGDSMDEVGIKDGDLVLIRQQAVAKDGDKVVALIDDDATIKEFQRTGNVVVLKPRSSNKSHKPIILEGNFRIQGVVVTTIPNLD
ncbi:MAG: transcriptional repressor LexA [Candidatus Woykebacteria bacterium]